MGHEYQLCFFFFKGEYLPPLSEFPYCIVYMYGLSLVIMSLLSVIISVVLFPMNVLLNSSGSIAILVLESFVSTYLV